MPPRDEYSNVLDDEYFNIISPADKVHTPCVSACALISFFSKITIPKDASDRSGHLLYLPQNPENDPGPR